MPTLTTRLLAGALCMMLWPATMFAGEPPGAAAPEPKSAEPAEATSKKRAPLVNIRSHHVGKDGTLVLEVEVLTPTPGQPVQIRPLIDGQAASEVKVAQSRNLSVADAYTLTLPVRRRDFLVSVIVDVEGAESAPAELRIRELAIDTRPALYALSVGVGKYRDPDITKLRYPQKDATDLAAALRAQRRSVYRDVQARVLTEENAGRAQVLAGLKWLQEMAREEDTALLYLAGHGTSDANGDYYFLPEDAMASRGTMISGAELQAGLAGIRGKVVLLLDTCHSGNVLGRRSLSRLLQELLVDNHIIVLAASTGEQASQESPAWQNGAFTKALIEGLRGAADYAEDGQIMMSELETWVGVRVKELTGGAQTPTLAKPNAAPDYVVAALPQRGSIRNPQYLRRQIIAWSTVGAAVSAAILAGVLVTRPWEQPSVELHFK
jgi:hypothetical protein